MELLTVPEAAKLLKVSPTAAYRMIREGVLPPGVYVHFGRAVRIDKDALKAHVANGGKALPGGWRKEPV